MLGIQMRSVIARAMFWSVVVTLSVPYPASADFLEEIIVTAKKREESLQDVSIAVTAFSQEMLRDIGLGNSNDLGQLLPGVEISSPSGNQQAKVFDDGVAVVEFDGARLLRHGPRGSCPGLAISRCAEGNEL